MLEPLERRLESLTVPASNGLENKPSQHGNQFRFSYKVRCLNEAYKLTRRWRRVRRESMLHRRVDLLVVSRLRMSPEKGQSARPMLSLAIDSRLYTDDAILSKRQGVATRGMVIAVKPR